MPRLPLRPVAALLLPALLLAACAGDGDDTSTSTDGGASTTTDGITVVATTTIVGDLVADVVGADGEVVVLMEPGQDPHGFAPSARQAALLREADLVVANGLGLEEGLLDVLESAESDGVEVLRLADQLDPLESGTLSDPHAHADEDHADEDHADEDHADEDHAEEDHADEGHEGHDHGPLDPHVWLDPVRMADAARLVATALGELAPDVDREARGDEVADELLELDAEVAATLAEVAPECRQLVTDHDSLGYLAARYDLEVVGTVVPGTSTQASTSAGDFAELAELLRDTGIPAVFTDVAGNQDLATSLADEVGRDIEVVGLYTGSLGGPDSGAETYPELMRSTAGRIADALADC